MPVSLGELATRFGCELIGDPDTVVSDVASLTNAGPASLTFLSNSSYRTELPGTGAAAVILRPDDADECPVSAILSDDPYAMYARMAAIVCPPPQYAPGVHASAAIDETADVHETAHIAANVVIGAGSTVGENTYVGPGTVIGPDCSVGANCKFVANTTLVARVTIGDRCIFHPGVVLGSEGFGNAMTPQGWVKVPQLGGVRIGSDVEVGANSTIDCGAIGDTIIGNGVRIDNLCMIAHNVEIGEHTAMAAMTGIAGSAKIGARCMFAGKGGSVGHITVCDDVVVGAMSFLSKDVTEPGMYTATFPAEPAKGWARQLARFRRLGTLYDRVKKLEK
ncbi:MAG: UDP-3-O-(3-hydroxymyristoyl)glucosamine N-acyltransferase [Pseudomonadota bacterium]